MIVLKTPEDRFNGLPGYPFDANYVEVAPGLNMHYVVEGASTAPTVLLLHGEPSWSYLYRKMIPVLTSAGYCAIAPDLIGFGKSDKPSEKTDYSYQKHLEWLSTFIKALDLQHIHLFCQDWGGLLGLRIALDMEERFASITVSNTTLPTGQQPMPPAFKQWQEFSQMVPVFPTGKIINGGTISDLSPAVIAAYDAPFPDESFKAGARIFPMLVPSLIDDPEAINNQKAWKKYSQWQKPLLTLFGDSDPIMKGADLFFQKIVPGAKGQPHEIIPQAGHFIQEDQGELVAQKLVDFINSI
ncbi:MAG: haloalkane dehalogenase [Saprospiraceae bacterium]